MASKSKLPWFDCSRVAVMQVTVCVSADGVHMHIVRSDGSDLVYPLDRDDWERPLLTVVQAYQWAMELGIEHRFDEDCDADS